MKTRIAIYGGTNLSPELVSFVNSLTAAFFIYPETVIVGGGFAHYIKHPERISVDSAVANTAKQVLSPKDLSSRLETWLPQYNDRENVVRFREGKVVEVAGSTQARRFNMLQSIDALVTISGKGNTQSMIELALAIGKPVLPLAFTGGDSKKMWDQYEEDIKHLLKTVQLNFQSQELLNDKKKSNKTAKEVAHFIMGTVKKTCLVLMPFDDPGSIVYDNAIKPAIKDAGYIAYRIDRNEAAGNIPVIFRESLEKASVTIIDITGYNPNVMYELGHVHAKNIRPLIVIRKKKDDKNDTINTLPFYLRQEMIIQVNDDKEGHLKLKAAINDFLSNRNSQV
ncbi:MAG: hypothetical protein QM731_01770 [Chitinophagaceae bacterium]